MSNQINKFSKDNNSKLQHNMDKLADLVNNNHQSNNDNLSTNKRNLDFSDNKKVDKNKKFSTENKLLSNDNQETRFSVKSLLEKNENQLPHKKNFFVISNELKDDNEDISWKMKREILINKLITDKHIVHEHAFNQEFHDKLSNEIFIGLSLESRKFLSGTPDDVSYKQVHEIIDFNRDYFKSKIQVNNDTIMNLCSGFIKLKDIFPDANIEAESIEEDDTNSNHEHPVEDELKPVNNETLNEVKNEASIKVASIKEEDENLNEEDLDILKNFIKNNPTSPLYSSVSQFLEFIKTNKFKGKTMNLSNKHKNEMIKELKKEYNKVIKEVEEQQIEENIIIKTETLKNKKIKKKNKPKETEKKEEGNPFLNNALIS